MEVLKFFDRLALWSSDFQGGYVIILCGMLYLHPLVVLSLVLMLSLYLLGQAVCQLRVEQVGPNLLEELMRINAETYNELCEVRKMIADVTQEKNDQYDKLSTEIKNLNQQLELTRSEKCATQSQLI